MKCPFCNNCEEVIILRKKLMNISHEEYHYTAFCKNCHRILDFFTYKVS